MKLSRQIAAAAVVALMFASQSWAQTPEPQIIKPAPTPKHAGATVRSHAHDRSDRESISG